MRRPDTAVVGKEGEKEAAKLLTQRGWVVNDLNMVKSNHPIYDLRASRNGHVIDISVKVSKSSNRHVRLGSYNSLSKLSDDAFLMVFLPQRKGEEVDISAGRYELWIIPGFARHVALSAHLFYHNGNEIAAANYTSPVMVKDKVDKPGGRSSSGAAFEALRKYKEAWHVLPA